MQNKEAGNHFDDIAENYHGEIKDHIRDHLIRKWWELVSSRIPLGAKVLDIGCGNGDNVRFLMEKGADVIGVDSSENLIRTGAKRFPELKGKISIGNALKLEYPENSFDITIFIGVLHHIFPMKKQYLAIEEALRVTKEGGYLLIRESNMFNPLFRLVWDYIFPLFSKIDKFGGENWISTTNIAKKYKGHVDEIHYFTFLPFFLPKYALPYFSGIEKWLEDSIFRKLGAHYIIVLKK